MNDTASDIAFREALTHHEAGRLGEAEALYRSILAQDPDHAESLHLLGLVMVQQGAPETGAALIARAMALAPGRAPHHNSLAFAYRSLGRGEDAVREYCAAAALRPHSAEIHNNLATTLDDLGRRDEAVTHYRRAAECAPDHAAIWYNLANALAETGPRAEAEAAFRRAIELDPRFADAHANYGRLLMTQARWAEAVARLTDAALLRPEQPPIWNNLGVALQELGRSEEAQARYLRALALDPSFADAHYNLGCLLHGEGRADEAVARHEAALAADPRHGAARLARCMAELPILYRTQDEVATRRRRYVAALEELSRVPLEPDAARSLADAIGSTQPFFLPYQGEDDRSLQAIYGRLACHALAKTRPAASLAPRPAAGERIRLGVVSGFFCAHTVFRLFLEGWLTQIDRSRFELIGFHTGHVVDADTARAAAWCDRFFQGLPSASAWREAVSGAAPHVLLYPEIGMDPRAAWLAAQRLAPVQCVAWGQPETSGMPTLDHFLSSELMEPSDGEARYTEQLVRLPHLGLYYRPDERPASRLDRAELGLHPTAPVYWSGQALYKYLPEYDAVFPRIAAELGACQFVFIAFARSSEVTAMFRERLGRAFAARGLRAEEHCVILPQMPQERFIGAVGLTDVILDTPGWSGGRSTLDCLAQDVPIVTLPGRFLRGRHTAAILRRIGCEATIARSLDDYVTTAVRLGRDAGWRAQLRRAMAAGKSRAFEDLDYIRALEAFLADAAARDVEPGDRAVSSS